MTRVSPNDAPDPRTAPSFLIKDASRELVRQAEVLMRPLGIGMASLPVLVALKAGEASTQADLARLLQVEQPSMAQMLARLERDGLVQRSPDPARKRVQRVALTELAVERLPQARAALAAGNQRALEGFTPDEVATFVDYLQRVNANLRDAA